MIWHTLHNRALAALGIIPYFINEADPRPAREQLHEAYAHGGGWQPFAGFTPRLEGDPQSWRLEYPGDRPTRAMAYAQLRDETVIVFEHSWVAIRGPAGVEIARMD